MSMLARASGTSLRREAVPRVCTDNFPIDVFMPMLLAVSTATIRFSMSDGVGRLVTFSCWLIIGILLRGGEALSCLTACSFLYVLSLRTPPGKKPRLNTLRVLYMISFCSANARYASVWS